MLFNGFTEFFKLGSYLGRIFSIRLAVFIFRLGFFGDCSASCSLLSAFASLSSPSLPHQTHEHEILSREPSHVQNNHIVFKNITTMNMRPPCIFHGNPCTLRLRQREGSNWSCQPNYKKMVKYKWPKYGNTSIFEKIGHCI